MSPGSCNTLAGVEEGPCILSTRAGEANASWRSSRQQALGLGERLRERQPPAFPFLPVFLPSGRETPLGSDGISIVFRAWVHHLYAGRCPQCLVGLDTDSCTLSLRCLQKPHPQGHSELIRLRNWQLHPLGNLSGAGQLYKRWLNCSYAGGACYYNKGLSNNEGTDPGHGHPEGLKIKGWITQSSLSLSTP